MPYNSNYTGAEVQAVLNEIPNKLSDAPQDSANYVRSNGAWVRLNTSFVATIVGPRQMVAPNGSGEQDYTFSFDQPSEAITLKSLSVSGNGISLKPGYSKSGFTIVATDITGDIPVLITATFTFGSLDYTVNTTINASYQYDTGNNGYDYVDLGLPSGTLWATCNIGATSPDGFGKYFMWGDNVGCTVSDTYDLIDGPRSESYYYDQLGLNAITSDLDLSHDAAHYHMGGSWHMPTQEQFQELYENTMIIQTSINGKQGVAFIRNDDSTTSIFLPAAGYLNGSSVRGYGTYGYYLTSSYIDEQSAYCFYYYSRFYPKQVWYRYRAIPIRAVI